MPRHATRTSYGGETGNPGGHGKKGRSGPRPKSLVLHLKDLRRSAAAQLALRQAACDPNSKNFGTAWRVLSEYDEEKPAEKKELSGKFEVSVKVVREGSERTAG